MRLTRLNVTYIYKASCEGGYGVNEGQLLKSYNYIFNAEATSSVNLRLCTRMQ